MLILVYCTLYTMEMEIKGAAQLYEKKGMPRHQNKKKTLNKKKTHVFTWSFTSSLLHTEMEIVARERTQVLTSHCFPNKSYARYQKTSIDILATNIQNPL